MQKSEVVATSDPNGLQFCFRKDLALSSGIFFEFGASHVFAAVFFFLAQAALARSSDG